MTYLEVVNKLNSMNMALRNTAGDVTLGNTEPDIANTQVTKLSQEKDRLISELSSNYNLTAEQKDKLSVLFISLENNITKVEKIINNKMSEKNAANQNQPE